MKVSIIIPVYNTPVADFSRCLDSIRNQTYQDFEIIVVDDGSRDEFVPSYQNLCNDEKTRYIRIKNEGVSHARNVGIQMAKGDYLAFSDADDTISEDFLKEAVAYAEKENADAVIGRICFIPKRGTIDQRMEKLFITDKRTEMLETLFAVDGECDDKALGSPCGRLFRREVVKDIRFNEKLKHFEDQIYNREIMRVARKTVFVPADWYYYYQNDYSAQHKCRKWDQLEGLTEFWDEWKRMNGEETDHHIKLMMEKKYIVFFNYMMNEGIRAGEKYNRKRILTLLNQSWFREASQGIRVGECRSILIKGMLILMKCRMTFSIYFGERLIMKMMRNDGSTVQAKT